MLLLLLASCGSSRKVEKQSEQVVVQEINLTPEQQRKYDYFFLEASRLKVKKEYTAAFDLLQHCLAINPTGSAALYEIAQYYLFLKQVPQGQEALEKAVAYAPDNYWYSQALAGLYQQQDQKEKAIGIPIIVERSFFQFSETERRKFLVSSMLSKFNLLGNAVKNKKLDTNMTKLVHDFTCKLDAFV